MTFNKAVIRDTGVIVSTKNYSSQKEFIDDINTCIACGVNIVTFGSKRKNKNPISKKINYNQRYAEHIRQQRQVSKLKNPTLARDS